MTSVIKNVGAKLIPFFKTLAVYFVVFIPQTTPSLYAAFLKCMPIICLMIFVVWFGKHMQDEKNRAFSKRIFFGLLSCCIGDFLLIWPDFFSLGMLFFAIGHLNYITAFGFKPLNLPLAIGIYSITILNSIYLGPNLKGVLLPGVPIYSFALTTMMWRAIARLEYQKKTWSWCRLFTCLGAISFVLSDFLIAVNMFKYKIPYEQVLVMSTYYLAQLGIALSIVDLDVCERRTHVE